MTAIFFIVFGTEIYLEENSRGGRCDDVSHGRVVSCRHLSHASSWREN